MLVGHFKDKFLQYILVKCRTSTGFDFPAEQLAWCQANQPMSL